MTTTKRAPKLSIEHFDTIDKDVCLSSYRLRSMSKISSTLLDENYRGASLIFGDSDDENTHTKKKTPPTKSPQIEDSHHSNDKKKLSPHVVSAFGEHAFGNDVDVNDFFENFDEIVKVKYSNSKGRSLRSATKTLESITKDLNCELTIESEKQYWAVAAGVKPPRKSSEDKLEMNRSLMWYLKQSTDKLQPLQELESGYSFTDDVVNKRREYKLNKAREASPAPLWTKVPQSQTKTFSTEKSNGRKVKQLTIEDSNDFYTKESSFSNNFEIGAQRPKTEYPPPVKSYQSIEDNDDEGPSQENLFGEHLRTVGRNRPKRPVLGDITNNYETINNNIGSINKQRPEKKVQEKQSFELVGDAEFEDEINVATILKKVKERAHKSENVEKKERFSSNSKFQFPVFKDSKAFPEAPRHSESGHKKLEFHPMEQHHEYQYSDYLKALRSGKSVKTKSALRTEESGEKWKIYEKEENDIPRS